MPIDVLICYYMLYPPCYKTNKKVQYIIGIGIIVGLLQVAESVILHDSVWALHASFLTFGSVFW